METKLATSNTIVGVLGVAPYATIGFMEKVAQLTPAEKDWDHIRLVVDNNVQIPNRTLFLLGKGPSPVPAMIDSCRRLANYPVDFIVVPCNNASWFIKEVREGANINIPIANIIEVTTDALAAKYPETRKVAVLGAYITYSKESYRPFLEAKGIQYLQHGEDVQKKVIAIIEKVKSGKSQDAQEQFNSLLKQLVDQYNVEAVILGCTEFGCLNQDNTPIPVVDSSHELAEFVVKSVKK